MSSEFGDVDIHRLFAEDAPRHIKALMSAWRDGAFLGDIYESALVAMGAEGHTAFVCISLAQLISCAYITDDEAFLPFKRDKRLPKKARSYAGELVKAARTADISRTIPLMDTISDDLGSRDIQPLIFVLVATARPLIDQAGGVDGLRRVTALVIPHAHALDTLVSVDRVGLALAAIAHGHSELGRTVLGTAFNGTMTLYKMLALGIAIAAEVFDRPGPLLVLDEDGVPQGMTVPGSPGNESSARLMDMTGELLRAVHAGEHGRAADLLEQVAAYPAKELVVLVWQLYLSIGYKLGIDGSEPGAEKN